MTKIYFLGTEKAIPELVADKLLNNSKGQSAFIDLSNLMVIVPSADSGRRLKEELAKNTQGRGLLLPLITTPAMAWKLFSGGKDAKLADDAFVLNAWRLSLLIFKEHPDDIKKLFHNFDNYCNNDKWLLDKAQMIQEIRITLANGGKTISEVVKTMKDNYATEVDRWEVLQQLEKEYLNTIRETGCYDPANLMLEVAQKPILPEGINRIIFAATPDPVPLAINAVEKLANQGIAVEIWICADKEIKDFFDCWGRPKREEWNISKLMGENGKQIQLFEHNNVGVIFVERPIDIANKIDEILSQTQPNDKNFDAIAFCVPDREVIPFLKDKLASKGLCAFDPAKQPLWKNPLGQLALELINFFKEQDVAEFGKLLRNVFVLKWIGEEFKIEPQKVIGLLDQIKAEHLPTNFTALKECIDRFSSTDYSCNCKDKLTKEIVKVFYDFDGFINQQGSFLDRYRKTLAVILDKAKNLITSEDEKVAEEIVKIIQSVEKLDINNDALQIAFLESLLLNASFEPTAPDRKNVKDLYGWLEAGWLKEPILIIAGMNEGIVPENIVEHNFLPDSLRKKLGLQDNDSRFARDAYLLYSNIVARKNGARENEEQKEKVRVLLFASRSSQNTEPRMPSRLLFIGDSADRLKGRVEDFFVKISAVRQEPKIEVDFKIDNSMFNFEEWLQKKREHGFAVSEFKDYLTSPFLYFLKHVVGSQSTDYDKLELDEAMFGTLLHGVLRELKDRSSISASALEKKLEEKFTALYGKEANLPFPLVYQKKLALKMIGKVWEMQQSFVQDGWKICNTEFKYKFLLPLSDNSQEEIVCRIDRIDCNTQNNAIRIIDYKVTEQINNPFSAHITTKKRNIYSEKSQEEPCKDFKYFTINSTFYQWNDLQLPLYVLAIKDAIRKDPTLFDGVDCKSSKFKIEAGYIFLTSDNASAEWRPWKESRKKQDPNSGVISETILDSANSAAATILECIKKHKFLPIGEPTHNDDLFDRVFPKVLREEFKEQDFLSDNFLKWAQGEK